MPSATVTQNTSSVKIHFFPDSFEVIVIDDGQGIDEVTLRQGREGHFGLRGMHAHAKRIGATLSIDSHLGRGTKVTLQVKTTKPTWKRWRRKRRHRRRIFLETSLAEPARPIEVLIVDDHPMVREGLAGVLARHQMKIVGLAANGRQAVEMYLGASARCDVARSSTSRPKRFRRRATVLKAHPEGRIIILSSAQGDASIYTAISLGVRGYLLKGIDGATLADQVRHVVAGGRSLSPRQQRS